MLSQRRTSGERIAMLRGFGPPTNVYYALSP